MPWPVKLRGGPEKGLDEDRRARRPSTEPPRPGFGAMERRCRPRTRRDQHPSSSSSSSSSPEPRCRLPSCAAAWRRRAAAATALPPRPTVAPRRRSEKAPGGDASSDAGDGGKPAASHASSRPRRMSANRRRRQKTISCGVPEGGRRERHDSERHFCPLQVVTALPGGFSGRHLRSGASERARPPPPCESGVSAAREDDKDPTGTRRSRGAHCAGSPPGVENRGFRPPPTGSGVQRPPCRLQCGGGNSDLAAEKRLTVRRG
jgi:hypothetical protein